MPSKMILKQTEKVVLFVLSVCYFTNNPLANARDLTTELDQCCEIGEQWFTQNDQRCDAYTNPLLGIIDHMSCKAVIQICCLKKYQEQQCSDGKEIAKITKNCDDLLFQDNSDDKIECCQCCKLGLNAGESHLNCNTIVNMLPSCGKPLQQCCMEATEETVKDEGDTDDKEEEEGVDVKEETEEEEEEDTDIVIKTTPFPSVSHQNTKRPPDTHDQSGMCANFRGKLCAHRCIDEPGYFSCACFPGFDLMPDGRSCKQQLTGTRCDQNNPCQHECVDTGIAIQCRCFEGYMLHTDGKTCTDVNECLVGTHMCTHTQTCENLPGTYRCNGYTGESSSSHGSGNPVLRCRSGYAWNSLTLQCEDIDECIVNHDDCLETQICINMEGSYRCEDNPLGDNCGTGYAWNRISRTCDDINECALNQDSCLEGQTCENTVGSYHCRRTINCGTGYTIDRNTQQCVDDDECLLGTHNCGPARVCRNTLGSFRCETKECPLGYKLDYVTGQCSSVVCSRGLKPDRVGNCVDINECVERPTVCSANQECRNTIGSYTCRNLIMCGPGYELNDVGSRCVDVNECERGTHDCHGAGQECVNRYGTYLCRCPEGYQMDHRLRSCEDINECERFSDSVCSQNANCVNTQGSFTCECKEGFEMDISGRRCKDIDECLLVGRCMHSCRNTWGSYTCICFDGYQLSEDGRTCEDVDECALYSKQGNQLCVGLCENTDGSYMCSCPDGYRMLADGRTCQDIDECALRTANCNGQHDLCINTRGSYKCHSESCPNGFVRVPSRSSRNNNIRCQRQTFVCAQGDQECLYAPLSYSINFMTFPSKITVPADLFTMRGPFSPYRRLEFDLRLLSARDPVTGVTRVSRDFFKLRRQGQNEAVVELLDQIPGPQDVELELKMNIYSKEFAGQQFPTERQKEVFFGTAVAKINIYVTEDIW